MLKSGPVRADSRVVEVPHLLPEPADDGELEIIVPDVEPETDDEDETPTPAAGVSKPATSDPRAQAPERWHPPHPCR